LVNLFKNRKETDIYKRKKKKTHKTIQKHGTQNRKQIYKTRKQT